MHTVIETMPGIWSVFCREERHPTAQFEDKTSADFYAAMRTVLVHHRETTGEYRMDAFNAMADFAEMHHRQIVKRTPGAMSARRAA